MLQNLNEKEFEKIPTACENRYSLDNLTWHGHFCGCYITDLATSHAPFDRLLNTSEKIWSRSQEALHTGQRLHGGALHHINDHASNQCRNQFQESQMDTNGATHRMAHNHNRWWSIWIHGRNHLPNIPANKRRTHKSNVNKHRMVMAATRYPRNSMQGYINLRGQGLRWQIGFVLHMCVTVTSQINGETLTVNYGRDFGLKTTNRFYLCNRQLTAMQPAN